MIIIETYTNATDAYDAKALLENNGIRCELKNDLLSTTQPIEKIELFVDEKDAKSARDVLANAMSSDDY